MEKTRQEIALETTLDNAPEQSKDKDLRTLKDLELLLVGGGGDDFPNW
jgi:hypothetical protein